MSVAYENKKIKNDINCFDGYVKFMFFFTDY